MPYVYVERDYLGDLIAIVIVIAVGLALARWEIEAFVTLLPGIFAFLATTFILCTGIIHLGRRLCVDGRLDGLRDAGFNPLASIDRAADAILSALPSRVGRHVARPSAAASETILVAGLGGLFAFGLSCWVGGALSTWQHTGRWSPAVPLSMAVLGAVAAVYGVRAVRRWLDRAYPKRPRVELLDHGSLPILDPAFRPSSETLDEVG